MPATVTLTFNNPLNASCQVGDTAYYLSSTASSGGFTTGAHSNIVEIGVITSITGTTAAPTLNFTNSMVSSVPGGSYILFSKDNKANMSSALGYYCEIKLKNTSTVTSELFSVGVDAFESSK
tara:strand:+ start:1563 stop:1928 length:366 start_codon:yes stop_codon:yes gene_type:complete